MTAGYTDSVALSSPIVAVTIIAVSAVRTNVAAAAAVVVVIPNVDALPAAIDGSRPAFRTCPIVAVRCCSVTNVAASAAIVGVPSRIDARAAAVHQAGIALAADPVVAIRVWSAADVAAAATVIDIPLHLSASAVATECARDAFVHAVAVNTHTLLVGTGIVADIPAAAAVVEVIEKIGAIVAATGQTLGAAVISACTAVRVRRQAFAHPAAAGR